MRGPVPWAAKGAPIRAQIASRPVQGPALHRVSGSTSGGPRHAHDARRLGNAEFSFSLCQRTCAFAAQYPILRSETPLQFAFLTIARKYHHHPKEWRSAPMVTLDPASLPVRTARRRLGGSTDWTFHIIMVTHSPRLAAISLTIWRTCPRVGRRLSGARLGRTRQSELAA
jgi:hypothetical protein